MAEQVTALRVPDRPILDVQGLHVYIPTTRGPVRAVDGVDFSVDRGRALGIVGESGSGKSMAVKALMDLLPAGAVVTGAAYFKGRDLLSIGHKELDRMRGTEIAMIFQDPGRSLNPVVRIGRQLTEGMRRHLGVSASEARTRAVTLLDEVGVSDPERRLRSFPHELSGGMRQRVMIAIALACEPDLLIADEPTTALDVTIQRQILDLLRRLQREREMTMLLISHDLAVVGGRTDEVGVMYAGKMAEIGSTRSVFVEPLHRYTEALLAATPNVDAERHSRLRLIAGALPDPTDPPVGCRFAPRCAWADEVCRDGDLPMLEIRDRHLTSCCHPTVESRAALVEELNR